MENRNPPSRGGHHSADGMRTLTTQETLIARIAAVVDSSDDAIISKTLDGIITTWNPGAAKLYGFSAEEAVGQHMSIIIPTERRQEFESILERIRKGERITQFDTVRKTKTGERIHVSVAVSPIKDSDGRVIGASKIAHAISDRLRAEQRRDTQYALTRVLSEARTFRDAIPKILSVVGEGLGWQFAQFWNTDAGADIMRPVGRWCADEADPRFPVGFEAHRTFSKGKGLPGRVWATAAPIWIADIRELDPTEFPRAAEGAKQGVRSVYAFPVMNRNEVLGVLECFTTECRQPDIDLLDIATALGQQIGQFVERSRAEAALSETDERFRLILDSTAEGIYGLDLQGKCTFCNPAALRILGYASEEDLLGRDIHALTHHTTADGLPFNQENCRVYQAFRTGEPMHVEDELFWRADGTSVAVEYWSYPIRKPDGGIVGAVVTFLDRTQRREAEQSLAKSEARFRDLAEASFDAIVVIENGLISEANSGFSDMFGYAPDEVIGKPAIDFVATENREVLAHRIERSLGGRFEYIGLHKNGSKILIEVTSKLQTRGKRGERLSALRNVTEVRLLETQLRQRQKMEAVGRMAGGVAHDFNNLLTVITSYSSMLLEGLTATDPRWGDVEEIRQAAVRAAGLTRQLLTFSRQQPMQAKPLDLGDALRNVEKMLGRLLGEDIELMLEIGERATILMDPAQLDQIVINLAVNARDAMTSGGRITISSRIADVDDTYLRSNWPQRSGHFALLTVSDDGSGMDEATLARIFEPFFTTKPEGQGTGLGLATVYGIVKQNNGFVWVYSDPGIGSTFKIYLPLIEGTVAISETGTAPPKGGSETILLVEDAPAVRVAVSEILNRYGYKVLEASNGRMALDLAAKHIGPIDLLITDVVMPGMSGKQVSDELLTIRPSTAVLYISGHTGDVILRRGIADTNRHLLQKPFAAVDLAREVRAILDAAHNAPDLPDRQGPEFH